MGSIALSSRNASARVLAAKYTDSVLLSEAEWVSDRTEAMPRIVVQLERSTFNNPEMCTQRAGRWPMRRNRNISKVQIMVAVESHQIIRINQILVTSGLHFISATFQNHTVPALGQTIRRKGFDPRTMSDHSLVQTWPSQSDLAPAWSDLAPA